MVKSFGIFLMCILVVCCSELIPDANTSTVSYSIIDSNHNIGVPNGVDSVMFLDGYAEGNGDFVFYGHTFKDGLFRTAISPNGASQTIKADARETYADESVSFGPAFNDYEIVLGKGLQGKLVLRDYGAPYAGGRLDVGPGANFDLEFRIYGEGDVFAGQYWYKFHTKTFLDARPPTKCEYEYDGFSRYVYWFHPWDKTKGRVLDASIRNFLNIKVGDGTLVNPAPIGYHKNGESIEIGDALDLLPIRQICVDEASTRVVEYPCFDPTAQAAQNRTYFFISNQPYTELPNPDIIAAGGLLNNTLAYTFWPEIISEEAALQIFYDVNKVNGGKYQPRPNHPDYYITIKRILPGVSSDLNQNRGAKNHSFDQANKRLFTFASRLSGTVKLTGINEFDDQLKHKRTRFTFKTKSNAISTVRACGLYKTSDNGFVEASIVQNGIKDVVILESLKANLDSLYAFQFPLSKFVERAEDFTPRFYEDGNGLHFVVYDGLSGKLKLFDLSSSGAQQRKEWIVSGILQESKMTDLVKLDNNKLVAAFSSGRLVLFDQFTTYVTKDISGRVKISGHENRIYYASVINGVYLELGSFDCSGSGFDFGQATQNNFDTKILNHQIYATAEGATMIVQIQPTAATTDMLYFKTDTQLNSMR